MLPWGRSSTSRANSVPTTDDAADATASSSSSSLPHSTTASTSTAHPSNTSTPPFLAQHHRKSSSNITAMIGSSSSSSILQRGGGRGGAGVPTNEAHAMARDNDPWEDHSDDEETVEALRTHTKLASLSISSSTNNRSGGSKERSSSPPSSSAGSNHSGSGWSFNPFSIVAGRSNSTDDTSSPAPAPPTHRAGPVAVAAALNNVGRGRAPTAENRGSLAPAPIVGKRSVSYLASAAKVQEEADKQVDEEEKEHKGSQGRKSSVSAGKGEAGDDLAAEGQAPPTSPAAADKVEEDEDEATRAKKSSKGRVEQCKRAIRPDVEEIVKDPVSVLARLSEPPPPPPPESPIVHRDSISSNPDRPPAAGADAPDDDDDDLVKGYIQLDATNISSGGPEVVEFNRVDDPEEQGEIGRERRRRRKFVECLGAEAVDLTALRSLAWAGIPNELRPMAWQLLMGYLPSPSARRVSTLARKRQEYADAVRLAFSRGVKGLDGPIWHQISIDVPRTNPGIQLWQCEGTQRSLERILYVWAIRHPASGYVQGINDLVTPFFQVFLSSYIESDPETYDVAALPPAVLEALEADSFWCLSKLLDGIQDNYIFAQPGITRQVARMKELCSRVDAPLAHHLEENSVEFIQFAFRWMNCLLMREMSVKNIIRMWDTYLAEGQDAFSEFHLYVCLAFLVKWSDQLREMDFQSIIMFLQSLPTQQWTDKNTELLLSEAFMWSRTFVAR